MLIPLTREWTIKRSLDFFLTTVNSSSVCRGESRSIPLEFLRGSLAFSNKNSGTGIILCS